MNNNSMKTILAVSLGTAVPAFSTAEAAVIDYRFEAVLSKLAAQGSAFPIIKATDLYQSHLTGTLHYDADTGMGTADFEPFQFDHYSLSTISDYTIRAIGNGFGGPGTLMISNFVIDGYLDSGISVSIVHDAAGFLNGEFSPGGLYSATPASDGTGYEYVDLNTGDVLTGYFNQGPVPIATTAWNTTNTPDCQLDNCLAVPISGDTPLIFDNETNTYDAIPNTGGAVGGSPIQDGRYRFSNVNIDFTNISAVPVPAAIWLLGSGLLGLAGLSIRRSPS